MIDIDKLRKEARDSHEQVGVTRRWLKAVLVELEQARSRVAAGLLDHDPSGGITR
ncbi:hypothetical protein M2336_002798 [Sphingobium sp. B1D7B]|uniref:hypothetical protein n=1 Tax=Sphingobium TaxID=165695 RepID=UPI0015EC3413|nr:MULTISPECIES: hypothetical protein [Sphingobium]MCW2361625.1 hypothetical protein [Sphingobium sp. B10D3B]MCW2401696.1 hypothetical protein [Sphingobium sp. B10D7B]MCW2406169.1 hypothetical protein [Sphingobium sp. B1D7B]MCW2408676.1 hypothetical protein [Sphingobium xanthum]